MMEATTEAEIVIARPHVACIDEVATFRFGQQTVARSSDVAARGQIQNAHGATLKLCADTSPSAVDTHSLELCGGGDKPGQWIGYTLTAKPGDVVCMSAKLKFVGKVPAQSSNFGFKSHKPKVAIDDSWLSGCKAEEWKSVWLTRTVESAEPDTHLFIMDTAPAGTVVRICDLKFEVLPAAYMVSGAGYAAADGTYELQTDGIPEGSARPYRWLNQETQATLWVHSDPAWQSWGIGHEGHHRYIDGGTGVTPNSTMNVRGDGTFGRSPVPAIEPIMTLRHNAAAVPVPIAPMSTVTTTTTTTGACVVFVGCVTLPVCEKSV